MPDVTLAVVIAFVVLLVVLLFAVVAFKTRPRSRQRFERDSAVSSTFHTHTLDAHQGKRPIHPSTPSSPMPASAARVLTPRERQIALLASSGMTNRQIADEMKLSPNTIANHLKNVFRKLDVRSRTELAWRLQFLDITPGTPPDMDGQ